MRKLLPVLLVLIGLSVGGGAGYIFRPQSVAETDPKIACPPTDATKTEMPPQESAVADHETEFVKLNNQFVVPVVEDGTVAAMVILSLSLEVPKGEGPKVFEREPKLRDALLQTLFNHANAGGFKGSFTDPLAMEALRTALLETARSVMGAAVGSILITDIVRQDA